MSCLMGYSEDRNQQKRGFSVNKYVHFMVICPPQSRFHSRLTWISTGDETMRKVTRIYPKAVNFANKECIFSTASGSLGTVPDSPRRSCWTEDRPRSSSPCYIFFPQ
jgi:hypothetical protein